MSTPFSEAAFEFLSRGSTGGVTVDSLRRAAKELDLPLGSDTPVGQAQDLEQPVREYDEDGDRNLNRVEFTRCWTTSRSLAIVMFRDALMTRFRSAGDLLPEDRTAMSTLVKETQKEADTSITSKTVELDVLIGEIPAAAVATPGSSIRVVALPANPKSFKEAITTECGFSLRDDAADKHADARRGSDDDEEAEAVAKDPWFKQCLGLVRVFVDLRKDAGEGTSKGREATIKDAVDALQAAAEEFSSQEDFPARIKVARHGEELQVHVLVLKPGGGGDGSDRSGSDDGGSSSDDEFEEARGFKGAFKRFVQRDLDNVKLFDYISLGVDTVTDVSRDFSPYGTRSLVDTTEGLRVALSASVATETPEAIDAINMQAQIAKRRLTRGSIMPIVMSSMLAHAQKCTKAQASFRGFSECVRHVRNELIEAFNAHAAIIRSRADIPEVPTGNQAADDEAPADEEPVPDDAKLLSEILKVFDLWMKVVGMQGGTLSSLFFAESSEMIPPIARKPAPGAPKIVLPVPFFGVAPAGANDFIPAKHAIGSHTVLTVDESAVPRVGVLVFVLPELLNRQALKAISNLSNSLEELVPFVIGARNVEELLAQEQLVKILAATLREWGSEEGSQDDGLTARCTAVVLLESGSIDDVISGITAKGTAVARRDRLRVVRDADGVLSALKEIASSTKGMSFDGERGGDEEEEAPPQLELARTLVEAFRTIASQVTRVDGLSRTADARVLLNQVLCPPAFIPSPEQYFYMFLLSQLCNDMSDILEAEVELATRREGKHRDVLLEARSGSVATSVSAGSEGSVARDDKAPVRRGSVERSDTPMSDES